MKKNVKTYLFFDNAATTRCCESAARLLQRFATEDFGNPSSSHCFGQKASQAIREARQFFATTFKVDPNQVIFTGGGTEADNLAVYGVAMSALAKANEPSTSATPSRARPRMLASCIEHPAVKKTLLSLAPLGMDVHLIPVDSEGQVRMDELEKLLTPETVFVSIQQVNNIVGSVLPVERIAQRCKELQPHVIFHTDSVQAFGKVPPPVGGSAVDLVSISAHKVHGPKGIGALIALNKNLLKDGIRPLIWGGEQEGGFRSGTQNAGLIAGFHAAAQETLAKQPETLRHVTELQKHFRELLLSRGLLHETPAKSLLSWNSPAESVAQIVSLSFLQFEPGKPTTYVPPGLLARMLEERGCLVSTGSACSSQKVEPDAVLTAMGLAKDVCTSSLRVSFAESNTLKHVETLVQALEDSITSLRQMLG